MLTPPVEKGPPFDEGDWHELGEAELPALAGLVEAALAADGGLPLFTTVPLLRARLLQPRTLGVWHGADLVAAASVDADRTPATATGLVHPAWRGRGIGTRLLDWADEQAAGANLLLTTETWTADAEVLFTARGFERTFLEWVLRHDLDAPPDVAAPDGVTVQPATLGPELFGVYRASFADRPGFVEPAADEWLGDLRDDEDYRPELSLVARGPNGDTAGFVTVLGNWIDQVGVVPGWRGRRIGAYLVARVLGGLAEAGADGAWLCVNDDNPAAGLYRRLGFRDAGRRARYLRR
ncbi:GNAT family N-acetyltransferase [Micromonospora sp. WMMD980]|uniref:GNAT family N-acetyltransferase n=1 Tax=Micromonospora sp. WMMD980 TaxID=3016088 RepID=UPI002417820A|nr:GNAT family N-acetyltransferase [Micromonospora sp. WMMD980]MDG4803368.1 GNAT family N-acetyltransferase [Micromonospora sp. WMMD980]